MKKKQPQEQTLSLSQRYDLLLHILMESPLTREERLESVGTLFPKFNADPTANVFEEFVTEYVLEVYGYYRSLGMPISEAAHAAEVSETLMARVMEGEGISLDTLLHIAKAELFMGAELKGKHLKQLDNSKDKGSTVTFLEKIYPKEYTQKGVLETAAEMLQNPKKWAVEITHVENKIKAQNLEEGGNNAKE